MTDNFINILPEQGDTDEHPNQIDFISFTQAEIDQIMTGAIPVTQPLVEGTQIQGDPDFSIDPSDLAATPKPIVVDLPQIKTEEVPHCSYCHEEITENDLDAISCKKCKAPYHRDCWNESKSCSALNCGGQDTLPFIRGQKNEISI